MAKNKETTTNTQKKDGSVDYRAVTKVFLSLPGGHGEPFCGPGMIKLLRGIKDTGNVRKSCELMGMSYSKGWKLLRLMEECLKSVLVFRQQGGKGGGEAHLTDEGEAFLKNFLAFDDAATKAVDKLFEKHFL
jgi:molybdate transport system regulatory protein